MSQQGWVPPVLLRSLRSGREQALRARPTALPSSGCLLDLDRATESRPFAAPTWRDRTSPRLHGQVPAAKPPRRRPHGWRSRTGMGNGFRPRGCARASRALR